MNLKASRSFQKSLRSLPKEVLKRLREIITLMEEVEDMQELAVRFGPNNVKLLKSGKGEYYRIKLGYRWRLGVEVKGSVVILRKIGSRENFYRDFP
ncbi:MAG: hypothetical protein GXO39_02085 [Thermotogae bacterium]|nr:hypothetical protein [Thermotogota bacterium]